MGNPAIVILNADQLSDGAVQAIAIEAAIETTAVYASSRAGVDFNLRFWLPGGEMSMCVHGLLGAVSALVDEGALRTPDCTVETKLGVLSATWTREPTATIVSVDQWAPMFGEPIGDVTAVLDALSLGAEDLDQDAGPVQMVSASRAKLFIPLRDTAALYRARPVSSRVAAVCTQHGVTGIYAFTCRPDDASRDVDARQFPVGAGYTEDPATGVAAAGLAAYLVTHGALTPRIASPPGVVRYAILQGEAMNCPCLLEGIALLRGNRVVATRVSGRTSVVT
jgi:trans-2,3-dihydro-3-hydroxyanthranilate isomerase